MAITHGKPSRKPSGALLRSHRKKRAYETGSTPTLPRLGEKKLKYVRMLGGTYKQRLLQVNKINVVDPKTKKCFIAVAKNVVENPANRYYVRRNVLTKGTVVVTDKGKVKITSRPGQVGTVNGVLVG